MKDTARVSRLNVVTESYQERQLGLEDIPVGSGVTRPGGWPHRIIRELKGPGHLMMMS